MLNVAGVAGSIALAAGHFFDGRGHFAVFSIIAYSFSAGFAYITMVKGFEHLRDLANEQGAYINGHVARGRQVAEIPKRTTLEWSRIRALFLFLFGLGSMCLGMMGPLMDLGISGKIIP